MAIYLKKLTETAKLPERQHPEDAGADIFADEDTTIAPLQTKIIGTGIAVAEIPPMTELQVRSRSGLSAKNQVFVLNSPGTIDENYRGEIKVILTNLSAIPFDIKTGDRIAQLIHAPILRSCLTEVTEVTESSRGDRGIGSTGYRI